jgi:hypothetical protein
MDRPRIHVDFNEMVEENLVLLSKENSKRDSAGNLIEMLEGKKVYIYDDDVDDLGNPDPLVADGIIELNTHNDWSRNVRWCCRINESGILHLSDLKT